ncbi:MAG: GTPase [Pseudomonadota bacterium]
MKLGGALRIAAVVALGLTFLVALWLVFALTDTALDLWTRLLTAPLPFRIVAIAAVIGVVVLFGWLGWRVLAPRSRAKPRAEVPALDESALRERLDNVVSEGVDASAAAQELTLLDAQRAGSALTIALYGEVSTGKSSLARALLPGAAIEVSPLAGSTTEIARHRWQAQTGAEITIADLPGLEAVGRELDATMLDEARRAHAVVFVTDGDLNRQQVDALQQLRDIGKPLIVTLNKADRYDAAERAQLLERLQQRLGAPAGEVTAPQALVVTIAGGDETVVSEDDTGGESTQTRERASDLSQLVLALEELLGGDLGTVNALREHALLTLAAEKLARAEADYRAQRAEQIVRGATRRAVLGALAAVTPGTDIVIQGYIGTQMTKDLCRLYGQQARDIEVEQFLDLSQSRVGKALPVALAIAGNGLKAFPGVGTIAGGLVHSVAYGLIFDAVGRGLAASLEREGAFSAKAAAAAVEEGLDEYLEQGVRRVARLALDQSERRDDR